MFDGVPIADLSFPTLVGITVILILLGRLVPWTVFKKVEKEAEKWQKAYEAEREARTLLAAQTAELLELARTNTKVLDALFDSTGPDSGRHRAGGPHVATVGKN